MSKHTPDPRSGLAESGEWVPAFPGQRPPFEPGHEVTIRHRSYSSDLRLSQDPRVAELAEWITDTQPVSHVADAGAIIRLALTYRRIELSASALDAADASLQGEPLQAYVESREWLGRLREDHDRWLVLAGKIEAELARTPASRGKLGLHLASARRALTLSDLHEAAALEDVEGS